MTNKSYSQLCGLAYALDRVGERWTLLIIRELIPGPRRFTDLQAGLPGISTNLLSSRLKNLEEQGLICRTVLPPPAGTTVYQLSPLGQGLEQTLIELGRWGRQFVPEERGDDALLHLGSYALTLKTFFRAEAAQDLDESYQLIVDREQMTVQIHNGEIEVRQGTVPEPVMTFHSDMLTYLGLLTGKVSPAEGLASGLIRVEGDQEALYRFLRLCQLPAADEPVH